MGFDNKHMPVDIIIRFLTCLRFAIRLSLETYTYYLTQVIVPYNLKGKVYTVGIPPTYCVQCSAVLYYIAIALVCLSPASIFPDDCVCGSFERVQPPTEPLRRPKKWAPQLYFSFLLFCHRMAVVVLPTLYTGHKRTRTTPVNFTRNWWFRIVACVLQDLFSLSLSAI
jgi:hypothetical protein